MYVADVDGAIAATPTHTDAAVAAMFLAAGVPVLVEKPIAESLNAAAELVRRSRESGVPILGAPGRVAARFA